MKKITFPFDATLMINLYNLIYIFILYTLGSIELLTGMEKIINIYTTLCNQ